MGRWKYRVVGTCMILSLAISYSALGECEPTPEATASASRYVVKGDVVYDKKTDLTWMRCNQGQHWHEGSGCLGEPKQSNCEQANVARTDMWRVSTIDELKTIVAKGCKNPAVHEAIFPDTTGGYWSSTKIDSSCWRVEFDYGGAYLGNWWDAHFIRLVRSGE